MRVPNVGRRHILRRKEMRRSQMPADRKVTRIVLPILGFLFFSPAQAQQRPQVIQVAPSGPPLVQTVPQGSYCEVGRDAIGQLAIAGQSSPPDLRLLYQTCAPGDTISFSASLSVFAALICDFSKSIILVPSAANSQIVCVISPQRGIRINRR